jgi:thiamine biosynthesis lipoprotein
MTSTVTTQRAWVEQIMGLPISIHLRGNDLAGDQVTQRVAAVFADLRHIDAVFSTYRDDNDLSRWERGELSIADADPLLAEVVHLGEQARERTDGRFDPHGLPDPRTGAPRYDPSGLVKGWAVERAARHLTTLDGYGWYLNAGGDVIVHAPQDQPPWRIGIENPTHPGRIMQVVDRRDGAVATSGTAHRGAHIIDPRTRRPATALQAVTVLDPELLWADVYATAAIACGADAIDWLSTLATYDALQVSSAGVLRTTRGWPIT